MREKAKKRKMLAIERAERELERSEKRRRWAHCRLKRRLQRRLRKRLARARPEIQRRVRAMLAFVGIEEADNQDPAGTMPRGRTFYRQFLK